MTEPIRVKVSQVICFVSQPARPADKFLYYSDPGCGKRADIRCLAHPIRRGSALWPLRWERRNDDHIPRHSSSPTGVATLWLSVSLERINDAQDLVNWRPVLGGYVSIKTDFSSRNHNEYRTNSQLWGRLFGWDHIPVKVPAQPAWSCLPGEES